MHLAQADVPLNWAAMERSASSTGEPEPGHGSAAQESSRVDSQRPALLLARPLELFDPACAVAGSVANCLPDPDAATRIVWGQSLDGTIRRLQPKLHQEMRKTRYILEKQHAPTDTTVQVIAQAFAPVIPQETTKQLLRGELAESELPHFLPWREFQRGLGPLPADATNTSFDEVVDYLVGREAFYARLFHHERAGRASPERAALDQRMQQGIEAWRELNPGLMRSVFPLVEELLHGIAWLELRLRPSAETASLVLALLAPERRPMGHWLRDVSRASGTRSLAGLQQALFKRDVRYKGENPFIKTNTLKQWSSCRQMLMPPAALPAVLGAVPEQERPRLEGRYFLVRVLAYLMALVRAGTQGEAPGWGDVQAQVRSRYTEVHRLQALLASG